MTDTPWVAFLRGMNVGARRVKNDTLIACFEELGFASVSAFLASGNVLFDGGGRSEADLQTMIEARLHDELGYEVQTFLRTGPTVADIAAFRPFEATDVAGSTGKLQVALLSGTPEAARQHEAFSAAPAEDLLAFELREMYWLPAGNMSDSDLDMKALAVILGPMTVRTQRTMQRLVPRLK